VRDENWKEAKQVVVVMDILYSYHLPETTHQSCKWFEKAFFKQDIENVPFVKALFPVYFRLARSLNDTEAALKKDQNKSRLLLFCKELHLHLGGCLIDDASLPTDQRSFLIINKKTNQTITPLLITSLNDALDDVERIVAFAKPLLKSTIYLNHKSTKSIS